MSVLKCIGGFHNGLLTNVPDGISDGFEISLPSYLSSQEPAGARSYSLQEDPVELVNYNYVVESFTIMRGGFRKEVLFLVPKGTSGFDAIISLLTA